MSSLKLVILVIIVFIILALGGIYVYQKQVVQKSKIQPSPTPVSSPTSRFPSPSSSPKGKTLSSQPATGSDTVEPQNIGIFVTTPLSQTLISSPTHVTGFAKVLDGKLKVIAKDQLGNILGSANATSCTGLDFCAFESNLSFKNPTTVSGTLEIYSQSATDDSGENLKIIPVRF